MRRSREQDAISAVNFGESIFCSTREVKSVASAQKHRGLQLLECTTRFPNNILSDCEPMPMT